jgi:glycerol-3-phosphate acyltransferase PlsY
LLFPFFIAYLIGAIPSGYLVGRWVKGIDLRLHGSGNIGASNSARLLGKKYFALIFLIDAGKAWAVLYGCDKFSFVGFHEPCRAIVLMVVASVLLFGNAYSCFIGFSGGKGVATTVGIIGYLYPPLFALLFCCIWAVILLIFRQAFLASLIAAVAVCLMAPWLFGIMIYYFWFFLFICIWLVIRHHDNIKKMVGR